MKITREELQAIENHMSNIPAVAGMYTPVLIAWCRALLDNHDDAYRRGAEAMRARCEEIARHACSVIGKLEHTYGIMTQGHIETVSRLILEADIPEEP